MTVGAVGSAKMIYLQVQLQLIAEKIMSAHLCSLKWTIYWYV